jgi:hypothetical protein
MFKVGDYVKVLRGSRLPIEEELGVGRITRISDGPTPLYWIDGFLMARDARVLRLAEHHDEAIHTISPSADKHGGY